MGITQSDIDTLLSTAGEAASPASGAPTTAQSPPGPANAGAPPQPASARQTSRAPREELGRILKLTLPLAVKLAEHDMPLKRVLGINVGVIIEFDRPFDAELDLMVGDCQIGAGQAVKVGENFGLRITRIGSLNQKIKALGGTG
ncbi:MAG TPA: FliM/FliN family flagellar motor switch protein [Phycisphaerae bacterium]|nr:FliM/FliN family flagellar motor switch protein [Phycisphaerae bacterium]HUU83990.1 FliM/FliN family flagellar motor switch protein [Phycisphaerae bacterium]